MSLRAESTADICALLLTYLKELPEPVLTPYLFNAFWNWSVRPSVKREDERMRKEQDEEEDLRTCFFQTGQRPLRPSSRVLYEKARLRAAQDETAGDGTGGSCKGSAATAPDAQLLAHRLPMRVLHAGATMSRERHHVRGYRSYLPVRQFLEDRFPRHVA